MIPFFLKTKKFFERVWENFCSQKFSQKTHRVLVLFFLLLCATPVFGQERIFSYQGISVRVDFLGVEEKHESLGEIVKNLVYFENEILEHSWIGQSTSLYKIEIPENPQNPVLVEISTVGGKKFSFLMKDLDMTPEGFLRSFKLTVVAASTEYSILNTQIDEKGDILERVLMTTRSLSAPWILGKCEEFVQGEWCSYSQYLNHHFTAYEIKSFLLDVYGNKKNFRTRDGILSGENSRKIMEREIQTQFSSETLPPFKIVNVRLEEHGRIAFLEFMDCHYFEKESFQEALHFDIHFFKHHGFGVLEKLIRRYQWKQGKKIFLSGQLSENFLTPDVSVAQMKDTWFDILPGQKGLSSEERVHQRAHHVFPFPQQKQTNIANTTPLFEEKEKRYSLRFQSFVRDGKTERKPVFESIRDVRYRYVDTKKQKIHEIQVDYFEIVPETGILRKTRTLTIELLKSSPEGRPLELMLKIISAEGVSHEERMTSDCHYVIQEAIEGTLFVLKEKKADPVCLESFSPDGQIQQAWIYVLEPNTSPAVVKTMQKIQETIET
jgi:hypothetical protein